LEEASERYRQLYAARPGDVALALEWARAWAWPAEYDRAERVLLAALRDAPGSPPLTAELARIYYYSDRLAAAGALLDALSDEELRAVDALSLRDDVRDASAVPDPDEEEAEAPVTPPTLLERAIAAREDDDFEVARTLLEQGLAERPDDVDTWLAYANLLQYEIGDFEGAQRALREVERLGASDAELQFRMALLEAWTGRSPEADDRLAALRAILDGYSTSESEVGSATRPVVSMADVHALAGDLRRWEGDRLEARRRYDIALASDPENARARDGLEAIRFEVARLIDEIEGPRMGSHAYGLGDTDDFERLDLAGEWIGVRDAWVWSGAVGTRWVGGRDLAAGPATRQGPFVSMTPARWWRSGTIRTSVHVGAERVRPGSTDPSLGAGIRYRTLAGTTVDVEYRHEPAYALATTLESLDAALAMDRLSTSLQTTFGERWSLAVATDLARLDPVDLPAEEATSRLQASVTLSKEMTPRWSLGVSSLGAGYSRAAPTPGGARLFWDPATVVAAGPLARLRANPSPRWETSIQVSPGLALIDERGPGGFESVPQLSADARAEYTGRRFRSAIDVFFSQARLEGYRVYGIRVSLSSASWLSRSPVP
jgi:tetratricopeptide (TPR) repeat protein